MRWDRGSSVWRGLVPVNSEALGRQVREWWCSLDDVFLHLDCLQSQSLDFSPDIEGEIAD
jgi:hypothetical protein